MGTGATQLTTEKHEPGAYNEIGIQTIRFPKRERDVFFTYLDERYPEREGLVRAAEHHCNAVSL